MYYEIAGLNTRILGAVHVFPLGTSSLPWWAIDAFNGSELIEMEHDHAELNACRFEADTKTLKPWALLFDQIGQALAQARVQPGVEQIFANALRESGRPSMTYIETGRSVAALFDAVPAEDLATAETAMHEFAPVAAQQIAALHAAWEHCDYAALPKVQEASPLAYVPSLRHAFFTARNENWANTIAARGASEKKQLLVVGALHLVGPDSLLNRLAARGLVVKRLIE